jgi:cytochrome P450
VVPLVIRRVVEQLDLGERQIPKGTTLAINIQAVHHNPKYWPDPNKFDPHRFMEKRPEPYTFLPFLEGPRNCLGQHLALLESKMVIGFLAQRYEFHMEEKPCLELFSRDDPRHRYIIPVIPNEDVKVIVTKK